jgi:hypothetical protein
VARASVKATAADEIIAATGAVDDLPEENEDTTVPYQLVGDASIPVSKKAGGTWKKRKDDALSAYSDEMAQWESAMVDYRTTGMLNGIDGVNTTTGAVKQRHTNDTDENLTRENVKTILRNTYTRNPSVELSSIDPADDKSVESLTMAITEIMRRKTWPGINAKAHVRRMIVHSHLTNFGALRLDYQAREGSRAEGYEALLRVREKMKDAKTAEEEDEFYADLEQIEENLYTQREPGMVLTNVVPGRLIIDPNTTFADLSDCMWVMEELWLGKAFIRKRYCEKREGKWVRKTDGKAVGEAGDMSVGQDDDVKGRVATQIMGYTTDARDEVQKKDKVKCYLVWDRLTRLISLYTDDDWAYPLFVWDDDLKLSRFFPYYILGFTEPVDGVVQPGESAQYAGQAREINFINNRLSFIRRLAFGTMIFNTRKIKESTAKRLTDHIRNPQKFDTFGMDWDPDTPLKDILDIFVPPDAEYQQLYDKTDLVRTIDRISSTPSWSKGEQFKTNTTNKAVEAYEATTASVANELTDAIEDMLEDLTQSMCELLVSKYSKEQITGLIGESYAATFPFMTVQEFNATFSLAIAAGSTEKPTSDNKRKEALQIAQAVGQVGQATPVTTMMIMVRMFKKAFSSFLFTREDQEMLNQEGQAFLQKGISQQQPPGGSPAAPPQQQG